MDNRNIEILFATQTFHFSSFVRLFITCLILITFVSNTCLPVAAQGLAQLPEPGQMVETSVQYATPVLNGIKVYANDPLRCDFIFDKGAFSDSEFELRAETERLIKYFLTSLTIPEDDLWVNLSPYEEDRIVPDAFGRTEMGRDLLSQDYILKQLTASLIHPEGDIGRKFWEEVYAKTEALYGTTDIPVDTFNKVWVVPEKAEVYENAQAGTAYIVNSKLKLLLDSDYIAQKEADRSDSRREEYVNTSDTDPLARDVLRKVVLPVLEREVNSGRNFAPLRQVYRSLILARWYKQKIKKSLLSKAYVDQNRTAGVNIADPQETKKIWERYVKAFKKGVYNYMKEEYDPQTAAVVARKYFSGGVVFSGDEWDEAMSYVEDFNLDVTPESDNALIVQQFFKPIMSSSEGGDNAMAVDARQFSKWKENSAVYLPLMLLEDEYEKVRTVGIEETIKLVKSHPEFADIVIGMLIEKLSNEEIWYARQALINVLAGLAKANPQVRAERIKNALITQTSDRHPIVRLAAIKAIAELARTRRDLTDEDIQRALVDRQEDTEMYVKQAAQEALKKLDAMNENVLPPDTEKDRFQPQVPLIDPQRMNKDMRDDLVEQLLYGHDDQTPARKIAEMAKARPDLMNENVRKALMDRRTDDNMNVREAVANALMDVAVEQQPYDIEKMQKMLAFLQDEHDGLGLSGRMVVEGMGLLFAFGDMDAIEGLNSFLEVLKTADQQQKSLLVDIGCSYFKRHAFQRFVEKILSYPGGKPSALISILQDDFLALLGVDSDIKERVRDGWDGISRLMGLAQRYAFLRQIIIPKLIITFRLLRKGAGRDKDFQPFSKVSSGLPQKGNLLSLLENAEMPLNFKRRLLQSFPFGDQDDIDLLRLRAVLLAKARGEAVAMGISGKIWYAIHSRSSMLNLPFVEAYKIFVETDGRQGREQLEKLGHRVSDRDLVPAEKKEQVLEACELLLTSLRQIFTGGNLQGMKKTISQLNHRQGRILDVDRTVESIERLLSQDHYNLNDLEAVVNIRQRVRAVVDISYGEALYQALQLELHLERLIYRVFNSMQEDERNAPKGLLLMLKSAQASDEGGQVLTRMIDELSHIMEDEEGEEKDLKVYAIIQRVERIIRATSTATVTQFQRMAEDTGRALEVGASDQIWVDNFSADLFRGSGLYLLSRLTKSLKDHLRNALGLSAWQAVVEGTMSGRLHYVQGMDGLDEIQKGEILFIDHLPDGDYPVLSRVAGIIVLEEDSIVSHPAFLARQNGIPFVVCPDVELLKPYLDREVTIRVKENDVDIQEGAEMEPKSLQVTKRVIELPKAEPNSKMFLLPEDYRPGTAGQKAYNLQRLDDVPLTGRQRQAKHVTLGFAYYQQVLKENKEQQTTLNAIETTLKIPNLSDEQIALELYRMREGIEQLRIPRSLLEQTRDFIRKRIPQGLVALRSSTNAEDLAKYAGPGRYDSFVAIDPDNLDQLEAYIKKVWASVWNDRAYADRERNGINHFEVNMAVLVHEMVNATYSYVIQTRNPLSNNPDEMVIDIVQGLGEGLVSGSAEYQGVPHRFVYNRVTGAIKRMAYAGKDYRLVLKDGRIQKELTDYRQDVFFQRNAAEILRPLFLKAGDIKQAFDGKDQDIEGCLVEQEDTEFEMVFVQSRDQGTDAEHPTLAENSDFALSVARPADVGGIDLTAQTMNLKINGAGEIDFVFDPGLMDQLQNAAGLTPVILTIRPLDNLSRFLGN